MRPYLHLLGEGASELPVGQLLGDRYLVVAPGFAIDSRPARELPVPDELPDFILTYLRLLPQRPQVPHVYGVVRHNNIPIWLLSYGHFRHDLTLSGKALPPLDDLWASVGPRRQLNWLWQIASLWRPLRAQGVAGALLEPTLLRASGSILQVLELPLDSREIRLPQLVPLWSHWAETAASPVQELLQQVCEGLGAGKLVKSRQLVEVFAQALQKVGEDGQQTYTISSHTSAGPKRYHNEDAFFQGGSQTGGDRQSAAEALAIVCDGIGGHEGGEVASRLAIEALRECLELPDASPSSEPVPLPATIERAIFEANARICERNDREQRQSRQRMGTTLTLAAVRDRAVHFAHVGDSRIYYISRVGCFQVTLDDDVATRATRLGHVLYANALQQANAGSLVQALGMGSSRILHPTLQVAMLDEDCVLLLCSDGLSDYDRVEQHWEYEILPILEGKATPAEVSQELVALADRDNGHDNATASLIYCQLGNEAGTSGLPFSEIFDRVPAASKLSEVSVLTGSTPKQRGWLPKLVIGTAIIALAIGTYAFAPTDVKTRVRSFVESFNLWGTQSGPSEP